ncbi:hypothetical protein C4587_01315 [Candidatus Parcubacteria bacterium]|nr:MAG: hypothetical protein C4587_01315 [Candidatus Parcubacteria bacterium]
MSGHSHWAGIKHKKEAADQRRGKIFSKLLAAITVAARTDANPEFNPRLRTAIAKAKEDKVPAENIERAIRRASEADAALEELLIEAYGPGGTPILIEAATDNKNRTIAQVRAILGEAGAKWAEPGSVRWAFEPDPLAGWRAKFPQTVSPEDKKRLETIIAVLASHDAVQRVFAAIL